MQVSVEQRWPAGRGETAEHTPRLRLCLRRVCEALTGVSTVTTWALQAPVSWRAGSGLQGRARAGRALLVVRMVGVGQAQEEPQICGAISESPLAQSGHEDCRSEARPRRTTGLVDTAAPAGPGLRVLVETASGLLSCNPWAAPCPLRGDPERASAGGRPRGPRAALTAVVFWLQ